ncbi:MAG: FAD-dependent tricarballylate dehydrogenase TcuA [Chloroflexi bacterium]|nr:FAD-dependent tricarballylate dehydrogenase TcuA [Chloroflexota bacterium]
MFGNTWNGIIRSVSTVDASNQPYDVIVVGGGNAALVAAISARHHAERVLVLERAPEWIRGGNSRHTRDIRASHDGCGIYTDGIYPEAELLDDLVRVGGGRDNLDLAKLVVRESRTLFPWMTDHGVRWQQPLQGTLNLNRTNLFFLGGGKALMNTYYQTAQRMGVEVRYDACVSDLLLAENRTEGVIAEIGGQTVTLRSRAVVVASGGFEANIGWLKEYWGEAADNFVIRGTPYNDGRVLRSLLDAGAQPVGDPQGFHAVAVDGRAPQFDGGIVTRLDSVPFGIALNQQGERFYDEGEDFWPKRYAIWGGMIARQPGQIAYSIFDARMLDRFMTSLYRPFQADTIPGLATALGLDPERVLATVQTYNAHAGLESAFDPAVLDGCATTDLTPPKSHWAMPILEPPFYGYPLRPGITFTYRGLAVDELTRVQMVNGRPMENLYAAGEIMAGNVLSSGYLAGFGLTLGTVFGRIAGTEAAKHGRD